MNNLTDVFIKTCQKDFDYLDVCLQSIAKNLTGFRRVVVVSDAKYTVKVGIDVQVVVDPDPAGQKHPASPSHGYFWQMVRKMQALRYTDADRVFILDSDMVITRKWDISKEPNKWFVVEWDKVTDDHKAWKPCADQFVGIDTKLLTMCTPGWFYTRHFMNCLLSHIEVARGHALPNFLWGFSKPSEFVLMGSFLTYFNQLDYQILPNTKWDYPIHQNWTWGNKATALKEMREALNRS